MGGGDGGIFLNSTAGQVFRLHHERQMLKYVPIFHVCHMIMSSHISLYIIYVFLMCIMFTLRHLQHISMRVRNTGCTHSVTYLPSSHHISILVTNTGCTHIIIYPLYRHIYRHIYHTQFR